MHQAGQWQAAQAIYQQFLAHEPSNFDALHLLGVLELQANQPLRALELIDKALLVNPMAASAYANRGQALKELKRLHEAIESYDQALALKPDSAQVFYNRGNALNELHRFEEALFSYDAAIALRSDYAQAFYNRGNTFKEMRRFQEALDSYDQALQIDAAFADAHNNRGLVLLELHRLEESIDSYESAIAIKPDFAEAFNNLGYSQHLLKRLDQALHNYQKAIALAPDYADAFHNRGLILQEFKRFEEAIASYEQAITLKPDYEFVMGSILHLKMQICDWTGLTEGLGALVSGIHSGKKLCLPFPMLALIDDPALQLKTACICVNANPSSSDALGLPVEKKPDHSGKIRVGYYSADFHNHATAYLMAELLESHDPQVFEIYGFSFGGHSQDEMRRRVASGFHQFLDVNALTDDEVVKLSRAMGIDIAVDLKGFTKDSRTSIFSNRCAPLQVNYLGYPGTMGAPFMDYIVADQTLIPENYKQHYTEKVVYLPHSYQVNDSKRKISSRKFSRAEVGLPEHAFVFCCFNNNYKILPETFSVWMRLLQKVDQSVLWLFEGNATAASNLRKEAVARGVQPERLVFANRLELSEHLARHHLADLFLDTLPCNAHTTASDALWAGLPVLTCAGQSFAARVAASLLNVLDLPELITTNLAEYEAKALQLATSPEGLGQIKAKLNSKLLTSPLFDGRTTARHLEQAYAMMYQRHQNGWAPDHLHVPS